MPSDTPDIETQTSEQPAFYARVFGVGEFPAELNRFSWGAFLLPFFWGIANNSWPVLTAWVVGTTSPLLIASMMGVDSKTPVVTSLIAAEVLSEIVSGIARLWAGANAYRLLWRRDSLLSEIGRPPKRGAIGAFLAKQRTWTIVGAIAMSLVAVGSIPIAADFWKDYGLRYAGPAISTGWLMAEVLLGMWLGKQMRAEQPAEVPDSQG